MSHTELKLNNGFTIPRLGLGTWQSNRNEVYDAVKYAIQMGYRHIDCAAVYGNEHEVGQALQEALKNGQLKREDLFITSKLWNCAHAPKDVLPAFEKTLHDLKLDYLDLYLMHWPVAMKLGMDSENPDAYLSLEECPLIETWHAMEALLNTGKVRSIGVSNFSIKKLQALMQQARIKPTMNQVEMHPYLQQPELFQFCQQNEIAVTAYCPLGSQSISSLTKADRSGPMSDETIGQIAKKHAATPAQILIAWAMARPTVVIPKSVKPARIVENFEAQRIKLDEADLQAISALDQGLRYVDGSFFFNEEKGYTKNTLWDE